MIEFLQILNNILIAPAIISFLLVLGYIADFSWGNQYDSFLEMIKNNKIFKFAFLLVFFSFGIILFSAELIYYLSRKEIKEKLNDKTISIKIDDKVVFNDNIITDFKNIKGREMDRISGNTELKVEINDMRFKLIKDMSRDSLFLVYYENYSSTSNNPIGKLISNSLKNY